MPDMIPKQQYDQLLFKMQQLQHRNEQLEGLNQSLVLQKQLGPLREIDRTVECAEDAGAQKQNICNAEPYGLVKYEFYAGKYYLEALTTNSKMLRDSSVKLSLVKQSVQQTSQAFSAFFNDFGGIMRDLISSMRVETSDKGVEWNGSGEIKVTYEDGSRRMMQYVEGEEKKPEKSPPKQVVGRYNLSPEFEENDAAVERLISQFEVQYNKE